MKAYLSVMMNSISLIICFLLSTLSCRAQTDTENEICNRSTVDKGWQKILPRGVCIPNQNSKIDLVDLDHDLNKDGDKDLILRYLEYPLKIGVKIYYGFYFKDDSTFTEKKHMCNLVPPYIGNLQAAALSGDSVKLDMINRYPYDLSVLISEDSIILSHLIPEDYGKTYVFLYSKTKENWFLESIQYWAGNLDQQYIDRLELNEKLKGKIILEEKNPEYPISIDEFDLEESKRIADSEESTYLMNNYDIFEIGSKD